MDAKESRAPEFAFVGITALLLNSVNDLRNFTCIDGEGGFPTVQLHPKRRQLSACGRDFVTTINGGKLIRRGEVRIDRGFMMPKMKSRTQFKSRRLSFGDDLVADMDRVLQVGQQHAFLNHDFANVISPDRESILHPELR